MGTDSTARPTRASRHRRQRPALRRALVSALTFSLLLAMMSVGVAAWAYTKYNGQITRENVLQTGDTNIAEPAIQRHARNYLIIGSDSRQGADARYGRVDGERSDTTILVHLAKDGKHASAVSIPRDSWVQIPTCKDRSGATVPAHEEMFNSAFSLGGARCTIATVQKLTGVAVTHFVQVDFAGFKEMVDGLGRVPICSPRAVTDSASKLDLHAGVNELDGAQALAYVRVRHIGNGSDLDRIKRQQRFMGVVLRQATSGDLLSSPGRLTDFLDAATKAVTVDKNTSFNDLRDLASAMQGLDPKRVTFYTAPISNPDYSPPGTDLTGKVKLDPVAGRTLYSALIHDRSLTSPSKKRTAAGGSSTAGAKAACTL